MVPWTPIAMFERTGRQKTGLLLHQIKNKLFPEKVDIGEGERKSVPHVDHSQLKTDQASGKAKRLVNLLQHTTGNHSHWLLNAPAYRIGTYHPNQYPDCAWQLPVKAGER